MKRIIYVTIILLLITGACQKEPEWQEGNTNLNPEYGISASPDNTHDVLAKLLAFSLNDPQVRVFLHDEISRQFTGDFDILYDLIKDREISPENSGLIRFSALLQLNAGKMGIGSAVFDGENFGYKNLQISSPVYFGSWDPETSSLQVVSLPEDYREGTGEKVKSYDSEGNERLICENDISGPFLLVRTAERVDEQGMMRVDPDGFVIPEEERKVSAIEAYEIACQQIKSAKIIREDPVIEVLDDQKFDQELKKKRASDSESSVPPKEIPETPTGPGLKSASSCTLSAPGNFSVHPADPYTIQINWSQVPGAVSYEIYRQYSTYPNYLLAIVDGNQINYFDRYLLNGENYTYSVRAVDVLGNTSVLTEGTESYASWRKNGNRDIIDKIYISSACWNWCCGLFDGKIELQYKTSYALMPGLTSVAYPGSGVNNLGQKTKSQQKGEWCYYNHYLFPWDLRSNSYSYRFKLIEDDGAGDGVTVKLGNIFKIQLLKIIDFAVPAIEFKIANKDEEFGEVIVQYWDWKNGPDYNNDGYNLMPKNGSARMYLRQ